MEIVNVISGQNAVFKSKIKKEEYKLSSCFKLKNITFS